MAAGADRICGLHCRGCERSCAQALQTRHVDDEAVPHIAAQYAFVGLVDVIHVDQLDLRADVVRAAEVEHFLGFGDSAEEGRGHAPLHGQREHRKRYRVFREVDLDQGGVVGVNLASAMGADVTVLSQSLKKMDDGLRLGADHYYATSDPDTFGTLEGTFDLIVNTVSANFDIAAFLGLLACGRGRPGP